MRRWSYGGNRVQLKAECKVLGDVLSALAEVANIGPRSKGPYGSIQAKQELLVVFIENEVSRLRVWLYPLEQERRHYPLPYSGSRSPSGEVCHLSTLLYSFY